MTTNGICRCLQMAVEMAAQHLGAVKDPLAGKHRPRRRLLHPVYRSRPCGLPRNVRCGAVDS